MIADAWTHPWQGSCRRRGSGALSMHAGVPALDSVCQGSRLRPATDSPLTCARRHPAPPLPQCKPGKYLDASYNVSWHSRLGGAQLAWVAACSVQLSSRAAAAPLLRRCGDAAGAPPPVCLMHPCSSHPPSAVRAQRRPTGHLQAAVGQPLLRRLQPWWVGAVAAM